MKTITHYHATKELLRYLQEKFPNRPICEVITILEDAKEKIEDSNWEFTTLKEINLNTHKRRDIGSCEAEWVSKLDNDGRPLY